MGLRFETSWGFETFGKLEKIQSSIIRKMVVDMGMRDMLWRRTIEAKYGRFCIGK